MAAHPGAPGDLELVRSFANTINVEDGSDELASAAGLSAFYQANHLVDQAATVSEADLAAAVTVRNALRQVLKANHGDLPDPSAVRTLNQALSSLPLTLRLDRGGSLSLEPARAGAAAALARLVAIVFRAMGEGMWQRLKICRSDACQWAFYDHSRNRSGSWCSMAVCGNRNKVREFQARARARARTADASREEGAR